MKIGSKNIFESKKVMDKRGFDPLTSRNIGKHAKRALYQLSYSPILTGVNQTIGTDYENYGL